MLRKTLLILFAIMLSFSIDAQRKCTGSASCTACTNCSKCKHCAQNGGSCGMCAPKTPKAPQNNIKKESKKQETTTRQCAATTKKGKRCSRTAGKGSNYCWQHNK